MSSSCRGLSVLLLVQSMFCGCNLELQGAQRALQSEEALERVRALQLLAQSKDPAFAAAVAPLLKDPAASVRQAAVAALGALGPSPFLAAIMDRLLDDDLEVRLAAVRVLGDSGSPRAKKVLLPLRRDASQIVRHAASSALKALGVSEAAQARLEAAAELEEQFKQLQQADAQLRQNAVVMLGLSGRHEALPGLLAALGDDELLVVNAAAQALGAFAGEQVTGALKRLSESESVAVRLAALAGLARLVGAAAELSRLAQDPAPEVQRAAVTALATLTPEDAAAAAPPHTCELLLHEDLELARAAAALVRVSKLHCAAAVKLLLEDAAGGEGRALALAPLLPAPAAQEALRQGTRRLAEAYQRQAVRWVPAEAWRLSDKESVDQGRSSPAGKQPETAGPADSKPHAALRRLLVTFPERLPDNADEDPLLPPNLSLEQVAAAMRRLADVSAALPWLADVAAKGPLPLRTAALAALASSEATTIKAAAEALAARLAEAVTLGLAADGQAHLRAAAAAACGWLGQEAVARAVVLLSDSDFEVQAAAAACLGRLGRRQAVEPLLAQLAREPLAVVIQALGRLGDRRATPALLALLQQEPAASRTAERLLVIQTLGSLQDRRAAPALEQQLTDPEWRVRQAAAEALGVSGRGASRQALAVCAEDFIAQVRQSCQRARAALSAAEAAR